MASSSIVLSLVLFLVLSQEASSKIPSYIHVCKRNDPKIEECIINSVEKLRLKLIKGIPELDVPRLEPMYLPEIDLSAGPTFKIYGKNIAASGTSTFRIVKLAANVDNIEYAFTIHIPFIKLEGTYDVDARILVFPIMGNGPFTANATNISGDVLMKGTKQVINGKTYAIFDAIVPKLYVKDYSMYLGNLFNGDKSFEKAINAGLNEHRMEIMSTILPHLEKVLGSVFLEMANKITRHFTFDELFPLD